MAGSSKYDDLEKKNHKKNYKGTCLIIQLKSKLKKEIKETFVRRDTGHISSLDSESD